MSNELELEATMVAWLRGRGWIVSKSTAGIKPLPQTAKYEESPEFTNFWAAYPRKENKASARKAWAKINPLRGDERWVIEQLKLQVDAGMFSNEPKFIPMASTWLNQERWDNPIVPKRQAPTRKDALSKFMED